MFESKMLRKNQVIESLNETDKHISNMQFILENKEAYEIFKEKCIEKLIEPNIYAVITYLIGMSNAFRLVLRIEKHPLTDKFNYEKMIQ